MRLKVSYDIFNKHLKEYEIETGETLVTNGKQKVLL